MTLEYDVFISNNLGIKEQIDKLYENLSNPGFKVVQKCN